MSTAHAPGDTGPPARRGPSVDLDPTGIVTGKAPDRQRQFLNYSFYQLDPVFRRLPADERRAAGAEFIELMRTWESFSLNSSYSYGIDDQDFVVAFDSDYPQEFVDLVGRLRYTEASLYTQRDTPMFTCAKAPIDVIVAQLANVD
jgi:chlorite dismutase